jgi:hypothetical protein
MGGREGGERERERERERQRERERERESARARARDHTHTNGHTDLVIRRRRDKGARPRAAPVQAALDTAGARDKDNS